MAIHNLMEDAATAEISRSQIWQWIFSRAITDHGDVVTREWVEDMLDEEFAGWNASTGTVSPTPGTSSRRSRSATSSPAFLTLPAYARFLHEARDGADLGRGKPLVPA